MKQPPSLPATALALAPVRHSYSRAFPPTRLIGRNLPRRSRAPFAAAFFTIFLAVLACCAATSISGSFSLVSWIALTPNQISQWASSCLTTTPSAAVCTHQVPAGASSSPIGGVHYIKHFQIVRVPTIAATPPQAATDVVADAAQLPSAAAKTATTRQSREHETEVHRTLVSTAASGTRIRHDS
jgi:hypothetical protein